MKAQNILIKLFTLTLFINLVSGLSAQEIKLQGKIYRNYHLIDDVLIQVYSGDSLLMSTESNGRGKFKLHLEGNRAYKLVFTKENYLPKSIVLAKVKKNIEVPTFKFDVELENEREFRYVDTSELDDPVATLFYNKSKGKLDWDRNQTFKVHEEIADLKDLNDLKRRERYRNF